MPHVYAQSVVNLFNQFYANEFAQNRCRKEVMDRLMRAERDS
jgi:hypothetical protein